MLKMTLASVAIASVFAMDQATQPTAEETVQAFRKALMAGNREAALTSLAPDVVIFEAGGAEMSRDEYSREHLPADIEFSRSVTSDTLVRGTGGTADSAWVLSRYRTRGSFHGRSVDSFDTETMVLHRSQEGWRIVHIHWSSHRVGTE